MIQRKKKEDYKPAIKLLAIVCASALAFGLVTAFNKAFNFSQIIEVLSNLAFIVLVLVFIASLGLIAMVEAGSKIWAFCFSVYLAGTLALPFLLPQLFRDFAWKDAAVAPGRIKEIMLIKGGAKSGDRYQFSFEFTIEGKSYSGYQTENAWWHMENKPEPGKPAQIQYNKSWPSLSRVIGK